MLLLHVYLYLYLVGIEMLVWFSTSTITSPLEGKKRYYFLFPLNLLSKGVVRLFVGSLVGYAVKHIRLCKATKT